MEGTINTEIKNNIATISFFHPAGNSFPSSLLKKLSDEFKSLGNSNKISIIILKSEGTGAFCAGASFDELLAVSNLTEGSLFFSGFANVINAMRKCPKLIIGRAHGKAVGGGVGLLAACDYVFGTHSADIKLSELAIGIGPFVIEPAVTRKIGKTAMSEMTLEPTAWKQATWALEKGLFAKIYPTIDELDLNLNTYTKTLSSYNPEALSEMKKVLWEKTENWDTLLLEKSSHFRQISPI